ncbi:hypothetical protein XANCAGTX0491_008490 [Xanthoria calcicola]
MLLLKTEHNRVDQAKSQYRDLRHRGSLIVAQDDIEDFRGCKQLEPSHAVRFRDPRLTLSRKQNYSRQTVRIRRGKLPEKLRRSP